MMKVQADDAYFSLVKRIVAETTGIDFEDIQDNDELSEIDVHEYPKIIGEIELNISDPDDDIIHRLPRERLRECETVGDLAELVAEVAEE
jgi:acyl carrier protein